MDVLVEVRGVSKQYQRGRGNSVNALRNVSLQLREGVCLGLVGESGCGKSTLCRMITGLERPTVGQILYRGELVGGKQSRGKLQMVFQNSLDAVNLHLDAYQIVREPLENFFHLNVSDSKKEVARLLELVGISADEMNKYPSQFSGGQLQRICIARALAARPELLLLDEPLSSLDVSVQAQIMNLLSTIKQTHHLTCLLISHDLKAVYHLSDAIAVMYNGQIIEQINSIEQFGALCHPYTHRLLATHGQNAERQMLMDDAYEGELTGCSYAPHCSEAKPLCWQECPVLHQIKGGHEVACWNR